MDAVSRIGGKIVEIDEVSTAIAAAMEEQSAATQEISRSVGQAAVAAQTVTDVMGGVVQIASETSDKATRLRGDADGLAESASRSRHVFVEAVRTSVSEAERRAHPRVPRHEPCELVIAGARHAGRLVNISQGGARVKVAANCSIGMEAELRIAAFGLTIPCKLISNSENEEAGVAFATPIELPPGLRDSASLAA